MSFLQGFEAKCTACDDTVKVLIRPKSRDLGGFSVKRVLPARAAPRVGPFVFFDEMGPADFPPGEGINVRPHPHIGLSTVTFLFQGEILHRDSLGFVQPIQPGAVNLMTAGRGIVHSERTPAERLKHGQKLHGIQVWMALPSDLQEIAPEFTHYPRSALPVLDGPGVSTVVVIGEYRGMASPVEVHAKTLYLSHALAEGSSVLLDDDVEQRAVYVVDGCVQIGASEVEAGVMAVLQAGATTLSARKQSQVVVIGGEDVGPRHLYWNFVHTSRQRIEQAKRDWREMKFALVPGDEEFIPLPDE